MCLLCIFSVYTYLLYMSVLSTFVSCTSVLCISFWRFFYICHVWEHTRWSILEDLHECQKSSTHTVKSVLVQPVETMHNTYFTKMSFPNCYLVLSLRDGQSGCCCQINQTICQATTVCNFVGHPIFTRFATFYTNKSQL